MTFGLLIPGDTWSGYRVAGASFATGVAQPGRQAESEFRCRCDRGSGRASVPIWSRRLAGPGHAVRVARYNRTQNPDSRAAYAANVARCSARWNTGLPAIARDTARASVRPKPAAPAPNPCATRATPAVRRRHA